MIIFNKNNWQALENLFKKYGTAPDERMTLANSNKLITLESQHKFVTPQTIVEFFFGVDKRIDSSASQVEKLEKRVKDLEAKIAKSEPVKTTKKVVKDEKAN